MRLSRWVRRGGTGPQLDEVHESVVILNVDPGTPQETVSKTTRMGGWGQRITGQHWDLLEMKVTFAIDVPKKNLILRRKIFDDVKAWAIGSEGSYMYTNQMDKKRMLCDKVVIPSGGDMFDWADSYDIIFQAHSVPFWQDRSYTTIKKNTITNGSITLDVPGEVTTVAGLTFTNKSGKVINNFSATVGKNKMTMSNLALPGSGVFEITHTSGGLLRILVDGKSVIEKRTGADDFYVDPGSVTVTINSDRAGALEVNTIGRYL